ncbi:MAG: hypothetical protein LC667_01175, partial [Thioalkalivibrio sp.]|nr:hypothetical protein [Thioalkalivibrio sp.]
NTYSGSTAWHNSARSRLALVESDGLLELRHEKANLGPRIEPVALEWTPDGVLVPAGNVNLGDRDSGDEDAVLQAITAATQDGADVSTARAGPGNTFLILSTFPDLPEDLRGTAGKRRFWAAVSRLERAGSIVQEEYRDARRHLKRRWLCAGSSARASPPHPLGTGAARSVPQSQVCAGSGNLSKPAQPAQDYRKAKEGW